jgi:hypothetical protein
MLVGFPAATGSQPPVNVTATAASARLEPPKAVLAGEPPGTQASLARYKQVKNFVQA